MFTNFIIEFLQSIFKSLIYIVLKVKRFRNAVKFLIKALGVFLKHNVSRIVYIIGILNKGYSSCSLPLNL